MASLQFSYDGYKKPEQGRGIWGRNMCFFPPRYNYQRTEQKPEVSLPEQSQIEESQPEQSQSEQNQSEQNQPEQNQPKQIIPEKVLAEEVPNEEKAQSTMKAENDPVQISEKLIENLAAAEANFNKLKERLDIAKTIFDKIIYKLDSMTQITEIIRENEVKSRSESPIQTTSFKTTKDSVDELLELLQGPVFQNILRQFLISIFIKNSDGTNFGRST